MVASHPSHAERFWWKAFSLEGRMLPSGDKTWLRILGHFTSSCYPGGVTELLPNAGGEKEIWIREDSTGLPLTLLGSVVKTNGNHSQW